MKNCGRFCIAGVLAPDLIPPDIVDVEYQNIAKYVNPQNSLFYSLDGSGVSMSPATEPSFFEACVSRCRSSLAR